MLSVLLSVLAAFLDVVWPDLLPPLWQALPAEGPWGPEAFDFVGVSPVLLLGLAALLVYSLLGLVAVVAMARFRRWGCSVSWWLTLLGLPVIAVLGPAVMSGWAYSLQAAGAMLWGVALAAAYWSPLAARFEARA